MQSRILFILFALGYGFSMPGAVSACSIPVFRYAMLRWRPDPYEVVIFHRGEFTPTQQPLVDKLQRTTTMDLPLTNCVVRTVDLNNEMAATLQSLWGQQDTTTLPWVVTRYPRYSPVQGTLWAGPLTEVDTLIDSPARKTIANRLLDGEAAVWILLEPGNKPGDDTAASLLQNELNELNRTFNASVPSAAPNETEMDADESDIRFSMIRLPRDRRSEQPLVEMLLSCESDLRTYDEIMAIPVFGRGRALYALVGKGITAANIREACFFLVEGCSCQVKIQNPGADLLMTADWESEVFDEFSVSTQPAQLRDVIDQTIATTPEPDESDTLSQRAIVRNSLIVVATGILVGIVGGLILYRRNNDVNR